ncbi:MAG: CtsR family transcriptional regulator [Synergistaceae bacterium]
MSLSITKEIEDYIASLITESEAQTVSLRRKDLAEQFGCVPSQINYVLRSRFAPENGFLVESQRGGHGYIRVMRLTFKDCDDVVSHFSDAIGLSITEQEARRLLVNFQNRELITPKERLLVEVALRNQEDQGKTIYDISPYKRDIMRAELLTKMLTSLALG